MSLQSRHYLVRADESLWEQSPVPGGEFQLLVGKEQSEGGYSMLRAGMSTSIPEHIHEYDDESVYMLEGELIAQLEDKQFHLKAGDFLYMPRKQRHQLIIESPILMLNIQTPGGIMDKLMEDVGKHVAAGHELDAESYAEIQLKHGVSAPQGWIAQGDA
jgi:quercetin dioxygenase-like cupin family protein